MQNLLYNISQVLGITILHSLWQGLIIFIGLRLFLLAIPAVSSATKYRVAYATLCAMPGWFIITLFNQLGQYQWLSTTTLQINPLTLPAVINDISTPTNKLYFTITQYMPYLTAIYVAGVVFNALKLSLSWNSIYRIRQNTSDAGFDNTIKRLSARLNITRFVHVAFSDWVDVPCVTGYIKPVILLPVAVTCYLSTAEVEAILLHELAHVKRNDYLLNFIQQVIGILLFFNPFTRLVNNIINKERENCCDDEVVHVTGSPFIYAQALLKLEENKQTRQQQLALAAATTKYELLNRIERIMKTKTQTVHIRPVLITVLALTCAVSSIAWLNPEIKNGKIVIKNAPAIKRLTAAITAPAKTADTSAAAPKHRKHIIFKYDAGINKISDFPDTVINNKKYKIVIEDENGVKKEYNSLSEVPAKDRQELMGKAADLQFRTDSNTTMKYDNYFNSDVWKNQLAEAQKLGMEMNKQFNTPEFKQKQKEMIAKSMASVNNPQFQKHLAEIQKQAMDVATAMGGGKVNSPQFKKQMAELQKSAGKWSKYYTSPEGKKQLEDLQKSAEDMGKYYDNPEFQKQMEDIGKKFDNPEFQKQIEDMVKKFVDKSTLDNVTKDKANKEIDKQIQKAEQKEKVEKKEKIEKKEQPEKPEKQENPQASINKKAIYIPEIASISTFFISYGTKNKKGC